ncbi:DNA-(apurinic or apyrimidinic site) lyase [Camellia lanceoleosa]|uniref:DNA-(Apurinic or apyrimidinic site) lyase n=1 Tax=Camellia lanceoleosa TaxID=1840588 RepID=A0ACC0F2K2_9ERIC|nr:DNA-(apurinic or apyrimidinic site) lyase [Camellia lanceoleosa]
MYTVVRWGIFNNMRQVKVNALDGWMFGDDHVKCSSDASSDVDECGEAVETFVSVKNFLHDNGGGVRHSQIEHLAESEFNKFRRETFFFTLEDFGIRNPKGKLVDAYRFLHKEKDMERGFSWPGNPVGKYRGKRMRIDYFVASEKLKDRIVAFLTWDCLDFQPKIYIIDFFPNLPWCSIFEQESILSCSGTFCIEL